jgi:hypothetical protein
MANVASTIVYASIAQYLSANEFSKNSFLKGGSNAPLKRLSRLLYIVRKAVDFNYQRDSTDSTLVATSNYLYWLSGKYNAEAAVIIAAGGTGTIINPGTGVASTVSAYLSQFVIGEVGSPMNDGDTVLTITADDFIANSVDVALDGTDLPINRNDRLSYTIVYSATDVVITFNLPVTTGQLYEVRGLRLIPA